MILIAGAQSGLRPRKALCWWLAGKVSSLAISVLALAVAAWAAVTARSQLRIQEDAAGGRGVLFLVRSPGKTFRNDVETDTYRVTVEVVGPGKLYQVGLHLERDGHQLDEADPAFVRPVTRKSLDCNDEPIEWDFELFMKNADDL